MNIKVCGITTMKQIQQLEGLNVDFAGLIFHKESPRYAGDKISPEELNGADLDLNTVGVFVNETYDSIMKTVDLYGLGAVQLHGEEEPEFCGRLTDKVEVIKTIGVKPGEDNGLELMIAEYDDYCDYYLFDTALPGANGGTGTKFDWKIFDSLDIEKPFFLSGGIGPNDVPEIKKFKHPDFYAIDINSKFEKSPGIKDMALLLAFTNALKR